MKTISIIHPSKCLGGLLLLLTLALSLSACNSGGLPDRPSGGGVVEPIEEEEEKNVADIDLSTWKVTLPIPREDGKPLEVYPPEILDYATNEILKPFMYDDETDASIVFYAYPEVSTTNSSYSRTELRELMDGSSNNVNWTFAEGGYMKGTLSVPEVSVDSDGDPHRIIIMQIHGRLTNEQRDLIGASDNNAPPILKIYWQDGKVRVKTKILKDLNATYEEILETEAWGDDEGRNFSRVVNQEKFTLEVKVSAGRMEVILASKKDKFIKQMQHK